MEHDKRKRKLLLLVAAVLVVAASAVVGFKGLRNALTDRLDFIYFAHGTQLSKQDADKLERDLKSDPASFSDRIELLAFYSFKIYKNGLTPEEVANRREHTLWVIEHQPASDFAGSFAAAFDGDDRDPEGVQQGKNLWLKVERKNPRTPAFCITQGAISPGLMSGNNPRG